MLVIHKFYVSKMVKSICYFSFIQVFCMETLVKHQDKQIYTKILLLKNITSSELKQIKIFVYSRKYSRNLRDYCSFQLKVSTTLKRYDHYLATIVEFEMPSKCLVKISWIIFCDKYFSVLLLLYQCHI